MKLIFFGSDDFAAVNLEKLIQSGHEIMACVTQPDRAKGRGLRIDSPLVKRIAQDKRIPVLQPSDLKDESLIKSLKDYDCDLFIVIAYGKILPDALLQIPLICAVNVHGSLLPQYRGAAPINWAIINGDSETGISIIKMNKAMDAGDILLQEKIKIDPQDSSVTLRARMAELSARCLCPVLKSLEKNDYSLTPQEEGKVSLAPKMTKQIGLISWEKPARDIHNLVRGLLPWPAAYTFYQGKMLKILESEVISRGGQEKEGKENRPGTVTDLTKQGIIVATIDEALLIKKVHLESAKAMDAMSFAAGHKITVGERWGE